MCKKKKFDRFEVQLALFKIESRKNKKHRQPKSKRKEKRFYYCEKCEGYHLTSMTKE